MKTILYIGNFSFPFGNAAGKRVYANGKLLRDLGYQVIYIGLDKMQNSITLKGSERNYDGFRYYNFPYPSRNLDWLNYNKIYKELVKFLKEENILDDLEIMICYGSLSLSFLIRKLIKLCHHYNIKIITDCVDWLSAKSGNPLFDLVKWFDNTYQKRYVNKKFDGVIAISNYLSDYYNKSGLTTVVIPPLSTIIPTVTNTENQDANSKKVITYAGLPFRRGQRIKDVNSLKDRIDKTILLLCAAKKRGSDFIFHVYGFTREEYLMAIPDQEKCIDDLGSSINFHNMTPNNEVVENVRKSDFTILIRDVNRDTTAGFPTKVSESISCGIPVITTKTSDLDNYIIDGKNGFFISNEINENDIDVVCSILKYDNIKVVELKNNCRQMNLFHYSRFHNSMKSFISKI